MNHRLHFVREARPDLLHTVHAVTASIMWTNLHLLFWLSTVPFFTAWMGENQFAPLPTAAYGVVLLACGFAYNFLFKVPVLDAPSFDGTRAVSQNFQIEIDETIDDLIVSFGVEILRLDPMDRDAWIPTVIQTLGLPQRPPQIDLFSLGAASR